MDIKKTILGVLICLTMGSLAKSQVKINFEVSFKEPQAHYAEVKMDLTGLTNKEYVDLKMPVWTPGSYLIREFAKSVESFEAKSGGSAVKAEKINKNTWRIHHGKRANVQVNYRVYAFELSVRTSFIDESHAFLSPTSIFLYPAGMIQTPSTVKIIPHPNWSKVSTGLPLVKGQPFTYTAADFDILFDSPIEVGNQDIFAFDAAGVKHEVAMYGGGNYDKERLKIDMAKIVESSTAIFGENPNKYYVFIVHNTVQGGGGLEHLNSTVLGATRNAYSNPRGYQGFLRLVAHEYFHLWNVKRLRPVALGPFDYDNENYTTNLWIAEGFTSFYEPKLLLRSGITKEEEFVQTLLGSIGTVMNTPGAKINSAAASSFDAWINGAYRPNENSKNTFISYYTKGGVVGNLLDLEIAHATKGAKGLDDVLKAMYEEGKRLKRGYTDAEFKAMAEKVGGMKLDAFWEKYVNGTADVEVTKYFAYAGIDVEVAAANPGRPYTGASVSMGRGLTVSSISRNSPAWIAGLNVNDEILTVDGVAISEQLGNARGPMGINFDLIPSIANKKINEQVKVKVKRDGLEKEVVLTLAENPAIALKSTIRQDASPTQMAVRKRWMGI